MAIESEAAEQSVGIALQVAKTGGEMAIGATKLGAVGVAKLMAVIYRKVKEGKELSPGEKKLQDMTKDGDNLHLFTAPEENLDLVHSALREYGIPYAVVDQDGGKDEFVDILVRERDAARAARALEKSKALEEPEYKPIAQEKNHDELLDDLPDELSEIYIEEKTDFDKVVEAFAGENYEGKAKVLCNPENPDDYILVKTEKEKHQNRTMYTTTFTAFRDGEQQTCSEYRHGNFVRRTDAEGKNTSEEGVKHWENVKNELKDKCSMKGEALVFASEEKYRAYLEMRKKERIARNTESYAKQFVEDVTRNPVGAKTEGAAPSEQGFRLRRRENRLDGNRKLSVRKKLREMKQRLNAKDKVRTKDRAKLPKRKMRGEKKR